MVDPMENTSGRKWIQDISSNLNDPNSHIHVISFNVFQ